MATSHTGGATPRQSRHPGWLPLADVGCVLAVIMAATLVISNWRLQLAPGSEPVPVDFAHFHALGYAALHPDERVAVADDEAWRELIRRRAPGHVQFRRVYGPQVALWFAPWALLPLPLAFLAWNLFSLAAIGACTAWQIYRFRPTLTKFHFYVAAGILSLPALIHLLIQGHAGAIAVTALTVAAAGLARRSVALTGLGLGILSFKPTLFLPVAAVALAGGATTAVAVALWVAVLLLAATVPVLGVAPITAYVGALAGLAETPDVVAKPIIMASLRTLFIQVLPGTAADWAYLGSALAVVAVAAAVWRRNPDPLIRIAVASLATVLATPHLYNYDLVITLPALVVSGGWIVERRRRWPVVAAAGMAAYVAPAVPFVAAAAVSPTAVANLCWFVALSTAFWKTRSSNPGAV